MGKSLVSSMLKALGIPVFDSDDCVHALLKGRALKPVLKAFPNIWDNQSQTIDKRALGEIIFKSDKAKETLESILHPMVWEEQQKFIAKCKRAKMKMVVLDIPLLFETGRDMICNSVICVTAPLFIQRQRVLNRNNMTIEKFTAILDRQIPDAEKKKLANIVIPTGLGRRSTLNHLKKALNL